MDDRNQINNEPAAAAISDDVARAAGADSEATAPSTRAARKLHPVGLRKFTKSKAAIFGLDRVVVGHDGALCRVLRFLSAAS